MTRSLTTRIGALETRIQHNDEATDRDPTDYVALRRALRERPANPTQPTARPSLPRGVAGVLHWRRKIAETAAMAALTPPPDVPGKTNFPALRIMAAQKTGGSLYHALRGAELEVLAEADFDSTTLERLEAEHARYAGIPWQWATSDLQPEAQALVEAAVARIAS